MQPFKAITLDTGERCYVDLKEIAAVTHSKPYGVTTLTLKSGRQILCKETPADLKVEFYICNFVTLDRGDKGFVDKAEIAVLRRDTQSDATIVVLKSGTEIRCQEKPEELSLEVRYLQDRDEHNVA